nr:zinc finger Y-chromosomal protein-like [Megalopta genalis]
MRYSSRQGGEPRPRDLPCRSSQTNNDLRCIDISATSNLCPKCATKFDHLHELRAHMLTSCGFVPKKMCPYCDTSANSAEEIHRHIRARHPSLRAAVLEVYNMVGSRQGGEPRPRDLPCRSSQTNNDLRCIDISATSNLCPKCATKFDHLHELRAHMLTSCGFVPKKMCPYCDTSANSAEEIHRHIRARHPSLRAAVLEVYNMVDLNMLDSYMGLALPGEQVEKFDASGKRKKIFYCTKCLKGFTLKWNRDRHYKNECGHQPRYKCPYCEKLSKRSSEVYRHVRSKHPREGVCAVTLRD